ncbi:MAG: hypothetical protein KAQ69_00525 [Spirochaetales bacterium]|nr:hypothetical protein [Spirochaetales bacterium]
MCKPNEVRKFNKEFKKEAKEILKSEEEVRKFLMGAGIITANGNLKKVYTQ